MNWQDFNKQALKVGLRPKQVQELQMYNLIVRLQPGFSKADVVALLRLARQGYLNPYYPNPIDVEDEEDSEAPAWVLPWTIMLMILSIVIILVIIDPSLLPPIVQHLIQLGG